MSVAAASGRPGYRSSWWLLALLVITAAFVVRFLFRNVIPYLSISTAELNEDFPTTLSHWALFAHLSAGSVAILSGVVQLWLGERRLHMRWHRRLGTIYVAAVSLGAAGALYPAATTAYAGLAYATGLFFLGIAWLTTTGMAYLSIRRRVFVQHREWMIRSYVVTLAFVFYRLLGEILEQVGIGHGPDRANAQAWLCWALPLLVTEVFIQFRKLMRAPAHASSG